MWISTRCLPFLVVLTVSASCIGQDEDDDPDSDPDNFVISSGDIETPGEPVRPPCLTQTFEWDHPCLAWRQKKKITDVSCSGLTASDCDDSEETVFLDPRYKKRSETALLEAGYVGTKKDLACVVYYKCKYFDGTGCIRKVFLNPGRTVGPTLTMREQPIKPCKRDLVIDTTD